jgi:NADPH:quinone reductase
MNSGDDIAGIVHSVESSVYEFKPGDRVASFHEMMTPHGSFAEYAVGWQHTTFKIPNETSFEEAASLPLAAMTSAIGLHLRLGLPMPWRPAKEETPLVVYGGASAVGGMYFNFFCFLLRLG